MDELQATFVSCRSSAAGFDGICYKMIINLPMDALKKLLDIYNLIWSNGSFPDCWKTAVIIPILKPQKNSLDPSSYRPISLLSCSNKIFEKMVSKRLKWIIEDRDLVDYYQSGNRKKRSTMDNLLVLEREIICALQCKEYVVAIFLDINKFFDRISKISVLEKLIDKNIGGPMFNYIRNFLTKPRISVKIDGEFSSVHEIDNSVRQGSSLSGDLSNIATCDISQVMPPGVMHGMFVDDLVVYVRDSNMNVIQSKLQNTLDKLSQWSHTNGLSFSPEKTFGVVFSRRYKIDEPRLLFQDEEIKFQGITRYLGLYFDSKLTWNKHIIETKLKGMKALNIMKILSNRNWGLKRKTLLRLYQAYVLPILDYGSIVYGSANPSVLKRLNVIHHTALRLVSGAFRTSPIVSLLAECGQPPLQIRRNILTINYGCRAFSNPKNPMFLVLTSDLLNIEVRDPNLPLCIRSRFEQLDNVNQTELRNVIPFLDTPPPWLLVPPKIMFLSNKPKSELLDHEVFILHKEFRLKYNNHFFCYTDGSKSAAHTGGAYLCQDDVYQFRLSNKCSIFTAELVAILRCIDRILEIIQDTLITKNFIICSDSQSSLIAIKNIYSMSPIIKLILNKLSDIKILGHTILFLWIPSHTGIRENNVVDLAAKNSTNASLDQTTTFEDLKIFLKQCQLNSWKSSWDQLVEITPNKLKTIKKDTSLWKSSHALTRRNEIILCRLRIGHTLATHKYLLDREDPPACEFCNIVPFTVKHLLLECRKLNYLRTKHNLGKNLCDILGDDECIVEKCLSFLSEANFMNKI
ncbi:hypothetical protein WDU94_005687 [Cyamophila willieti]